MSWSVHFSSKQAHGTYCLCYITQLFRFLGIVLLLFHRFSPVWVLRTLALRSSHWGMQVGTVTYTCIFHVLYNLCRATSGGYIRFWLLKRGAVPRRFIFHGQCFGRGDFFAGRERQPLVRGAAHGVYRVHMYISCKHHKDKRYAADTLFEIRITLG